jgi:serine/threonine protein kinase
VSPGTRKPDFSGSPHFGGSLLFCAYGKETLDNAGHFYVAFEFDTTEPMAWFLERNHRQPFDLTRFMRLAIAQAKALGQVHRDGPIHKGINPANVFLYDAGNVWLTGFGIASLLLRQRQSPVAPPEIIAGILAYVAAEQTGLGRARSIDVGTDLYSLGVTLYQMLTGVLPFDAANPLDWVPCHSGRQPKPTGDRAAVLSRCLLSQ